VVEKRFNHLLEILLINLVDLGGNLDRNPSLFCNFNGSVRALLRRDPSQKSEVVAAVWAVVAHGGWQAVINSGEPIDMRRHRSALIIGDRN
jgi:hypothetical protein